MRLQPASFTVLIIGLLAVGAGGQPSLLSEGALSWSQPKPDWDKSVSQPPRTLKIPSLPSASPAVMKGAPDPTPLPVSLTKPPKAPEARVEEEALGGPAGAVNGGGTDIINEVDERKKLDGSLWPYRAIVRIETDQETCSGWMASANTVITAAHCLSSSNYGEHQWAQLGALKIHPAVPFNGACKAVRIYVTEGWRAGRGRTFDYGAIKLDCNLGDTTGSLGFKAVLPTKDKTLYSFVGWDPEGRLLSDLSRCQPCGMRGRVVDFSGRVAFHELDTTPGMSGSPIYLAGSVVVIHVTDADQKGGTSGNLKLGALYNSGPFIVMRVYQNLMAWIRDPAS